MREMAEAGDRAAIALLRRGYIDEVRVLCRGAPARLLAALTAQHAAAMPGPGVM